MPYMVQSMCSGSLNMITYYRKQSSSHVSHGESGSFTKAALKAYATTNNIAEKDVEKGKYRSGQGVPSGGTCMEI